MRFERFIPVVLLSCFCATQVFAGEPSGVYTPEEAVKRAKEMLTPDMLDKAKQSIDPGFDRRVQEEVDKIKKQYMPEDKTPVRKDVSKKNTDSTDKKNILSAGEHIYIFISSSIPLPTLRAYAAAIDRLGEPVSMVMRGTIGDIKYFKPTIKFVKSILVENDACAAEDCPAYRAVVDIDPELFTAYGIDRVPAVVYVKNTVSRQWFKEFTPADSPYWVYYGDAPLDEAIEKIGEKTGSGALKELVRQYRVRYLSREAAD